MTPSWWWSFECFQGGHYFDVRVDGAEAPEFAHDHCPICHGKLVAKGRLRAATETGHGSTMDYEVLVQRNTRLLEEVDDLREALRVALGPRP